MQGGRRAGRPCRLSASPARTATWGPRALPRCLAASLPRCLASIRLAVLQAILEVFRSPTASEGPGPRRPTAGYSRRLLQPYRQWLKAPSSLRRNP